MAKVAVLAPSVKAASAKSAYAAHERTQNKKACEELVYIVYFFIPLSICVCPAPFAVEVPVAALRVCTKSAEAATHSGKKQGRVCVFSHSH